MYLGLEEQSYATHHTAACDYCSYNFNSEGRLEDLFETIESLPADKVEAAEKVCDRSKPHPQPL